MIPKTASFASLLIASLALGCSPEDAVKRRDPEYADAPVLTLADSSVLVETDSQFTGGVAAFLVAPDGVYVIADHQTGAVLQYAADGRVVRRIGRRGNGPGEFSDPQRLALAGDSLLFVADNGVLEVFDYRTGEFVRQVRTGRRVVNALVAWEDRVYFNDVDREIRTSVTAIDRNGTFLKGGPFPSPLGQSRILDDFFSAAHISAIGGSDTIAIAFQNSNRVLIGSFSNGVYAQYDVAVRRRHGAPAAVLATITDEDPAAAQNAIDKFSLPVAIVRLSNGNLAYVAADEASTQNRRTAKLYVSVIDPGKRRSCVDAPVPVAEDPHPLVAFRGDTLVVLSQEVSRSNALLIARKFTIETADCEWIPEPGTPGA